jgi:hypothetical protein
MISMSGGRRGGIEHELLWRRSPKEDSGADDY